MTSSSIVEREFLYRLVVGQLLYDGLENCALFLGNSVGLEVNKIPPSPQLLYATRNYKNSVDDKKKQSRIKSKYDDLNILNYLQFSATKPTGLNFDIETEGIISPTVDGYECQYSTSHKAPCTTVAFSNDGRLLATGSQDTSIKILEVEKIFFKTSEAKLDKGSSKGVIDETASNKNHPVVRTLYDHTATITCLDFHPSGYILASGGADHMINFFDYSKPSSKKAAKTLTEVETINSISFHPTGDYMIVAVEHPTIRMYDINTQSCFTSSNPYDQHQGPVNTVKFHPTGKFFLSSSIDGSLKIWDGVSNKCTNTFKSCHKGLEIISATFSQSGNYILSASIDTVCKLWDIRTGTVLQTYAGCSQINNHRCPAFFNQNEDFVIYLVDQCTFGCWNSRTGEKLNTVSFSQNSTIRCAAHSPSEPALVSGWEDSRIRFCHFGNSH